ncbi:MAG TPA: Crp/Fnr family transcriptional regulator [Gammaproteobacteria bacterium]|nr:Crp/Fnr family transcriptional regulator [Gammaproteobacteria bacterium]
MAACGRDEYTSDSRGVKLDVGDAVATLRTISLFRQIDPEQLHRIACQSRFITFKKEQFIFHKGDACNGIYIAVLGTLRLFFLSAEGKEHVVRILGPGQSFAEAVAFNKKPCPVNVQALSDATVLLVPKGIIFEILVDNPECVRSMLAGLSLRLHQLIMQIEALTLNSGIQRVIGYLLQHGADLAAEEATISLPASKTVIASLLNLTPESFSRVLRTLCEERLIEVDKRNIRVLDLEGLRTYGA